MRTSYTHLDGTERRLVVNVRQAGLKWKTIKDITGRSNQIQWNIRTRTSKSSPINDTERRLVGNMRRAGLKYKTIRDITSRSCATLSTIVTPPTKKNPKSNPKDAPNLAPDKDHEHPQRRLKDVKQF